MHANEKLNGAPSMKARVAALLAAVAVVALVALAGVQSTTTTTTEAYAASSTTTTTATPVALVYNLTPGEVSVTLDGKTSIGTITPDIEFVFAATESSASSYQGWLGDWVVTFSYSGSGSIGDVALIGQYDAFSSYWFPCLLSNVQAGTEYHLMETVFAMLGYGYAGVTYSELCSTVKEFRCAAVQSVSSDSNSSIFAALKSSGYTVSIPSDVTMTVELRLYDDSQVTYSGSGDSKTIASYGNYVTIGSYSYTF